MHFDGSRLGAGANSGFQAVNLAALAGAAKIVLTGFDMQHTGGRKHWHADHTNGLGNPPATMLSGSAAILDQHAPILERRGITVLNATRETALRCYRRVSMGEALG